ncbi:hypothetical protein MSTO_38710 [Mycobacterium stomatepiae]|uniref:TetR family transcriptional regulator n=1 Tax=Mycobacterium stomatepiae TaxID=470076 RepID=A0A7I7QC98_9MYCO|nr:hypothetical protein [Mycobacterium stomatepiae]BBY23666.1 hypothetical protein MSTO_38710 [Mycobacterium stomatepiae]
MSAILTKAAERGEISADRDWSLVADVLVAAARCQTVDVNLVRQAIDILILPAVLMPDNE